MYVTTIDVENAKNLISIGDYVVSRHSEDLRKRGASCSSIGDVVGQVVEKSKYVFVIKLLDFTSNNILTAFNYADLILPNGVEIVSEEEAISFAEDIRNRRYGVVAA